ncbi:MAG: hypothetical protein WC892_00775 [Patescibacteria group bacterium]
MRNAPSGLRFFWQAVLEKMKRFDARFAGLKKPYRILLTALLVAVPVVALYGHFANAGAAVTIPLVYGGTVGALVLIIISGLIYLSAVLMFILNMVLMYLVIFVAGYNNFVYASPVMVGWPLVRDVANMFFIVVLLVIAFGTIVGYQEVDYRKYLPKLLLMAVLINFSKLLVGLLIDFSQVIMLTFVNGFKDAAFGNFAKLFGLDKIFDLGTQLGQFDISGAAATMVNIFMSLIFSMIMLAIMSTLLLIMLIYLVARIVGLWIVLIFSPMAFFVWAVPPKLSKGLSAFAGQWWKVLGALLSGGPIMAFFIWLTLAIVAGSDNPFSELQSANSAEMTTAISFIGQLADLGQLSRFIIGVTLLFFGIKTAIQVSGEVSETLKSAASKISSAGGPIGYPMRLGGRVAGKAARGGAKLAGKGASYGLGILDQKTGFTKNMGEFALRKGGEMGKQGGLQGVVGGLMASGGVKAMGISGARKAAAEKHVAEQTRGLSLEQTQQFYHAKIGSINPATGEATEKMGGRRVLEREYGIQRSKELEDHYRNSGIADPEQAKAAARQQLDNERGAWIKQMRTAYPGDKDLQKELTDELKKNSHRQGVNDAMKAALDNGIGDMSDEAVEDSAVMTGFMRRKGFMGADGKVDMARATEDKEMKAILGRGGKKAKALDSFMNHSQTAQGSGENRALLQAITTGAPADIEAAEKARRRFAVSQDMKQVNMVANDGRGGLGVTRWSDAAATRETLRGQMGFGGSDQALDSFAGRVGSVEPGSMQGQALRNAFSQGVYTDPNVASYSDTQAGAMGMVQIAGVPTSVAFGIQDDGNYQTPAFAQAHSTALGTAIKNIDSPDASKREPSAHFVSSIDPGVITRGGAAAQAVIGAVKGNVVKIASAAPDAALIPALEEQAKVAGQKVAAGVANQLDRDMVDIGHEIESSKVAKAAAKRGGSAFSQYRKRK